MKIIASVLINKSEHKASFYCEESGFAKHAHFQDKQKIWFGMIT